MLENRLEELEKGLRKLMGLPQVQDAIKTQEEELAEQHKAAQEQPTETTEASDGKDG